MEARGLSLRRAGAVRLGRPFSPEGWHSHGGSSCVAEERGGPRGETHGFRHLPPRLRPYTPMRGSLSNVWHDRYKISNDCPEHIETIDSMCQALTSLIDDEVKSGTGKNRILLGGFSMGGGMAMHLAYRYHQDVAGVFALSSFLSKTSAVYQALKKIEREPPELFQCHGTADELVLYSWGEETNKMLKSLGVATTFLSLPNLYHELNKSELDKLQAWILKKLPE
uniref:lysophospholipase-like protein 1 isoform X2 n=1 Tax=Podarcis muralis TaxID=64176 RepID=UPI00109FA57F|nr:lysophospholipase-like protein 1 isoform X2 [Podarcis muralis]